MLEALIAGVASVVVATIALVGRQLDRNADQRAVALKKANTAEHTANAVVLDMVLKSQDRIEGKLDDHIEWHAQHPVHPSPQLVVLTAGEAR